MQLPLFFLQKNDPTILSQEQERLNIREHIPRRDHAGFSLIEVMVVGGVMLTLGLGAATLMTQQSKQFKNVRSYANRDGLTNAINAQITQPYALLNSMGGLVTDPTTHEVLKAPDSPIPYRQDASTEFSAGNLALYDCYWETTGNNCTATTNAGAGGNGVWTDFYLIPTTAPVLIKDNAIGGPTGSFLVDAQKNYRQDAAGRPALGTSDSATPPAVRYDLNGRGCAATEKVENCPLVLRTQFQAHCVGNLPQCPASQVDSYNIQYVLHNLLSGVNIPNQGQIPVMLDKTGRATIKRSELDKIVAGGGTSCLEGEVQVSADGATTHCARARATDISTCAAPKVLRVQTTGTASELVCEDPFLGNDASSTFTGGSTVASSATGLCPSPKVASGIGADGKLRCDYPLNENGTANTANNQQTQGACKPGYVVTKINPNGSVECKQMGCRYDNTTNTCGGAGVSCTISCIGAEVIVAAGAYCGPTGSLTDSRPLSINTWLVACTQGTGPPTNPSAICCTLPTWTTLIPPVPAPTSPW